MKLSIGTELLKRVKAVMAANEKLLKENQELRKKLEAETKLKESIKKLLR